MSNTDTVATTTDVAPTLKAVCRRIGRPIRAYGSAPIILSDPADCFVVEAGTINLFAVSIDGEGRPSGRRAFVRTLGEGELMLGADPDAAPKPMCFLAVGDVHSEVLALPVSTLLDHREEIGLELPEAIDTWIGGVSKAVGALVLPRPSVRRRLDATQTPSLEANERVTAQTGVVWIGDVGDALWSDSVDIQLAGTSFPLHRDAWLATHTGATATVLTTAVMLTDTRFASAVAQFHAATLEALATNVSLASADDLNQKRDREDRDTRLLSSALGHALSVNQQTLKSPHVTEVTDQLTRIVAVVAHHLGFPAPRLQNREELLSRPDKLLRLLHSSDLRSREVSLEPGWWRLGGSAMIATTDDGGLVALIPRGRRGYSVFDPDTGLTQPVTRSVAETVTSPVHAIYPTLLQDQVTARDLLAMSLRGTPHDVVALIGFGLAAAVVGLLTPYVTGFVINEVIPYADQRVALELAGVMVAVGIAVAILNFLQSAALLRAESTIEATAQPALWDRVLRLPSDWLKSYSIGDLAQRVMGLSQIRTILSQTVTQSMLSGVFSLVNLLMMMLYGGWLTLTAVVVTLVAVILTTAANIVVVRHQRQAIAEWGQLSGLASEGIGAVAKLRVAGAENRILAKMIGRHAEFRRRFYTARLAGSAARTLGIVIPAIATLAFFITLAVFLDTSYLRPGDYVAFVVAFGSFIAGVVGMLNNTTAALLALVYYERLKPILSAAPERSRMAQAPPLLSGHIELSDVTYRYHEGGPTVLNKLNLTVEPGQFVAVVGPSGSGKSTILRLLLGFASPEAGSVLYDGQDLSKLDLEAIRQQFGVVLQNAQTLGGSIQENIIGSRALTQQDAWEAAAAVGLAEDIQAMPMQMQTVVNDGGTISGGQRQRLMLARAIAGKPNILFLDEATSALDNATQAVVTENLSGLALTRVVIAHRLSTIKDADKIYVIEGGEVVETGTYETLMASSGAFADLARRQLM